MLHTKFQVRHPALRLTFKILAFIEAKWSIFLLLKQCNFLVSYTSHKIFWPPPQLYKTIDWSLFRRFFWSKSSPFYAAHCAAVQWNEKWLQSNSIAVEAGSVGKAGFPCF